MALPSSVTNQVIPGAHFFSASLGGGGEGAGGAHIKVTGEFVFLLRCRDCELWSHLGWPGRKANIFFHTGIVYSTLLSLDGKV